MDQRAKFYKKLKKKLKNDTKFPSKYLFKFIIPTNESGIQQIEGLFNYQGAVITKTPSRTGKYVSISILVVMKSADAIIEKYKAAEQVEGIISL